MILCIPACAGRERPSDGNDETTLEGTREDSCFPAGFWHPYGRGANVPPTRVVSWSPEFLAQVTLKLPDAQEIAAAQVPEQAFIMSCPLKPVILHPLLSLKLLKFHVPSCCNWKSLCAFSRCVTLRVA